MPSAPTTAPTVLIAVSLPTQRLGSRVLATRCKSSGNVSPISVVGTHRITSAASARTISRPPNVVTVLPRIANSRGS